MVRPDVMGTITWLAENGDYTIDEELIEIEFQGQKTRHTYISSSFSSFFVY